MFDMFHWFPCVLRIWVSFPFDEVLCFVVVFAMVEYRLGFVLWLLEFRVDDWWWWLIERIRVCWFEPRDMEYWMYSHLWWKFEFVVYRSHFL